MKHPPPTPIAIPFNKTAVYRAAGAVVIALAFSCLYLSTRTWAFNYDAMTAVLTAERGGLFPFHPNHLFANGLGWIFFKTLPLVGMPIRAIFVFQTVNAVVGGVAVGAIFYLLTVRFSSVAGLLGALGFGFSHALWSESIDGGAYASTALFAVILTEALLRLSGSARTPRDSAQPCLEQNFATLPDGNACSSFFSGGKGDLQTKTRFVPSMITGLLLGAGILVHQMFLLTIPAFLIVLCFPGEGHSIQQKIRSVSLFLAGVFLAGIVPYVLIARFYYNFNIHSGIFWFLGPAGPRPNSGILVNSWWQWRIFQNVGALWNGLVNSMMAPLPNRFKWAQFVVQALMAMGLLSLAVQTIRLFINKKSDRAILAAVLSWMATMNLFQFFWVPGTIRFRILFFPVMILWACIALQGARGKAKRVALIACLILGIGLSNGVGTIGPAAQFKNNRDVQRALWVRQQVGSKDFFLFAGVGDSIMNVVPPYFAPNVPSRSLYGYFFANPSGDFGELGTTIEQTLRNGGTVYMEESLFKKETWVSLAPDRTQVDDIHSTWISQYETVTSLSGPFDFPVVEIRLKSSSNRR